MEKILWLAVDGDGRAFVYTEKPEYFSEKRVYLGHPVGTFTKDLVKAFGAFGVKPRECVRLRVEVLED